MKPFPANNRRKLLEKHSIIKKEILSSVLVASLFTLPLSAVANTTTSTDNLVNEVVASAEQMHPISYVSRDGLTIHGYLTLPKNKVAENLPLIVIPHGGPWARDVLGFNPEVQLLANRGYAVLQVNFRSSTGYGRG